MLFDILAQGCGGFKYARILVCDLTDINEWVKLHNR